MNNGLPGPLVLPEVDLTGFSAFMLDVDRLLASELVAVGSPEECWAAVLLWCRAWKQKPAASLPNDDRVLAAFSGAGRRWPKIKAVALRGFIECSDGRLYHRVLAGEANEAWNRRKKFKDRSAKASGKRWPGKEFEQEAKSHPESYPTRMQQAGLGGRPKDNLDDPCRLRRDRTGQDKEEDKSPPSSSDPVAVRVGVVRAFEAANNPNTPDTSRVDVWLAQGYAPALILAVVKDVLSANRNVRSLTYFDGALKRAHEERPAQAAARCTAEGEPTYDFGCGFTPTHSLIRMVCARGEWLADWGPRPGEEGSRITRAELDQILREPAAA